MEKMRNVRERRFSTMRNIRVYEICDCEIFSNFFPLPLRVLWRQICVLIFFMITLVSYSGGGLVGKCHLCAEVYPIYHHLVEDKTTRMLVLLYFCLVRYIVCQAFLCVGLVCLWSRRFCYRVFFLHFNDKWYIYRVDNFHKYSLLGMCSSYICAQNTNVKS